MKQISLTDALENCAETCGWCINHCDDEEKYEILVNCIRIQKEFLTISRNVNSMLGYRSVEAMKLIIKLFENLASDFQKNHSYQNKIRAEASWKPDSKWTLPGCSQIFLLAQSLDQLYLDAAPDND